MALLSYVESESASQLLNNKSAMAKTKPRAETRFFGLYLAIHLLHSGVLFWALEHDFGEQQRFFTAQFHEYCHGAIDFTLFDGIYYQEYQYLL
jgi:hypothetical protein